MPAVSTNPLTGFTARPTRVQAAQDAASPNIRDVRYNTSRALGFKSGMPSTAATGGGPADTVPAGPGNDTVPGGGSTTPPPGGIPPIVPIIATVLPKLLPPPGAGLPDVEGDPLADPTAGIGDDLGDPLADPTAGIGDDLGDPLADPTAGIGDFPPDDDTLPMDESSWYPPVDLGGGLKPGPGAADTLATVPGNIGGSSNPAGVVSGFGAGDRGTGLTVTEGEKDALAQQGGGTSAPSGPPLGFDPGDIGSGITIPPATFTGPGLTTVPGQTEPGFVTKPGIGEVFAATPSSFTTTPVPEGPYGPGGLGGGLDPNKAGEGFVKTGTEFGTSPTFGGTVSPPQPPIEDIAIDAGRITSEGSRSALTADTFRPDSSFNPDAEVGTGSDIFDGGEESWGVNPTGSGVDANTDTSAGVNFLGENGISIGPGAVTALAQGDLAGAATNVIASEVMKETGVSAFIAEQTVNLLGAELAGAIPVLGWAAAALVVLDTIFGNDENPADVARIREEMRLADEQFMKDNPWATPEDAATYRGYSSNVQFGNTQAPGQVGLTKEGLADYVDRAQREQPSWG